MPGQPKLFGDDLLRYPLTCKLCTHVGYDGNRNLRQGFSGHVRKLHAERDNRKEDAHFERDLCAFIALVSGQKVDSVWALCSYVLTISILWQDR